LRVGFAYHKQHKLELSMKPLYELTPEEYQSLFTSGRLWENYTEACGDYARDTQVNLEKLQRLLNECEEKFGVQEHIYNKFFKSALQAEGVNARIADIIISEAYEQGHSGGYSEVICVASNILDLAKRIIEASTTQEPAPEPVKPSEDKLQVSTVRF